MKTAAFRKLFLPVVYNIHVFDVEKLWLIWLFSMFGVQKRTRIKEMTNDKCVSTFDKNGRWRNHACVDKNGKPKNFISNLKPFFAIFQPTPLLHTISSKNETKLWETKIILASLHTRFFFFLNKIQVRKKSSQGENYL